MPFCTIPKSSDSSSYLAHAGKKGMKWGYNDGKKNGNRTASDILNDTYKSKFKGLDTITKAADEYNKVQKSLYDNKYLRKRDTDMVDEPWEDTIEKLIDTFPGIDGVTKDDVRDFFFKHYTSKETNFAEAYENGSLIPELIKFIESKRKQPKK